MFGGDPLGIEGEVQVDGRPVGAGLAQAVLLVHDGIDGIGIGADAAVETDTAHVQEPVMQGIHGADIFLADDTRHHRRALVAGQAQGQVHVGPADHEVAGAHPPPAHRLPEHHARSVVRPHV